MKRKLGYLLLLLSIIRLELTVYLILWCSGNAADRTDEKEASTCEGSAHEASEGHTLAPEIEKRPFYFLSRVPRYDDEKLAEQLMHAEAQVDLKTKSRDALRADIQTRRVRSALEIYLI